MDAVLCPSFMGLTFVLRRRAGRASVARRSGRRCRWSRLRPRRPASWGPRTKKLSRGRCSVTIEITIRDDGNHGRHGGFILRSHHVGAKRVCAVNSSYTVSGEL